VDAGTLLEWQYGSSSGVSSESVERSDDGGTAWQQVAARIEVHGMIHSMLDPARPAPASVWYRLNCVLNGVMQRFGPYPGAGTERPTQLGILGMAPNPVLEQGAVAFCAREGAPVRLAVVDVSGRCVATLFEGKGTGWIQHASWNVQGGGTHLAPGIYLVRMETSAGIARSALRVIVLR
jgi:hypothetical protein